MLPLCRSAHHMSMAIQAGLRARRAVPAAYDLYGFLPSVFGSIPSAYQPHISAAPRSAPHRPGSHATSPGSPCSSMRSHAGRERPDARAWASVSHHWEASPAQAAVPQTPLHGFGSHPSLSRAHTGGPLLSGGICSGMRTPLSGQTGLSSVILHVLCLALPFGWPPLFPAPPTEPAGLRHNQSPPLPPGSAAASVRYDRFYRS